MKILLTNDDGIHARGLWALYDQFSEEHEVTVVAPDQERSAISHAISLYHPLRIKRVDFNGGCTGYAVNGTPADCVKLGILEVLAHRPNIVVSGINPGANVGVNINYSGTVAAAREAALYGLPAVAVSIGGKGSHFDDAAKFIASLIRKVADLGLPFGTFLNVNIPDLPAGEIRGIVCARQNIRPLSEYFEKRTDPRTLEYYWPGADSQEFDNDEDIDGRSLHRNFISVTPLKCDQTDYETLETIRNWDIE